MGKPASKAFLRALAKSSTRPAYASEIMLRVSWSCLSHEDGQPQHIRRGEVMLDLGLESGPSPDLTSRERGEG